VAVAESSGLSVAALKWLKNEAIPFQRRAIGGLGGKERAAHPKDQVDCVS
jgi:hypothetical protein